MIIGRGMLANKFADYEYDNNVVILASGVSNSKEVLQSEFDREERLIREVIHKYQDKIIVYFSTSSMYDPDSRSSVYTLNKLKFEQLIIKHVKKFYIFRLTQIIGRSNNNTLINFLINHISNGQEFMIWKNVTRNLIALEDVYNIINFIIKTQIMQNEVINIANPNNISILDIVKYVELVVQSIGNYNILDNGSPFDSVNVSKIKPIISRLAINFQDDDYYKNAIEKIYRAFAVKSTFIVNE